MKKGRAQFQKNGVLAIAKASFSSWFDYEEPKPFRNIGGIGVVEITGPMTHHADWFWDNYDSITERANAAFTSDETTAVILKIDSPGGDCSGCYETVRALRAMAVKSKKKLFAYADGMAASGGYALACAAEAIFLPETGFVGSIGVVQSLYDCTKMNEKHGVNVAVIASGTKKSYGNPDVAIDEGAIAEVRGQVDTLAEMFFVLVAESRGKLSTDQIRSLEAGIFLGKNAVSVGLADGVCTFDELLAMVASKNTTAPAGAAAEATMSWKEQLQKAADEGDEEAKKALAALEEEPAKDDEPKKDSKKSEEKKDDEKVEGDEPAKDDDKKKDDDKAAASASIDPVVAKMASELQRLSAKDEASERAKIMTSRPDIKNATVLELLAGVPLSKLQATIDGIEKPKGVNPAAAAGVTGTRGDSRRSESVRTELTIEEKIDQKMGVSRVREQVRWEGADRILPSNLSRESALEILQRNKPRAPGAVGGGK